MIHHQVQQNTDEWKRLRLGVATSSEFDKIFTPQTRKLSKQSVSYMHKLLAEWIAGEPLENEIETYAMRRGHELEPAAVLAYEMLAEQETMPGGFITTDDGMLGCSPDRLVADIGDVEIKSPLLQTQVEYALKGTVADEYKVQLQGRLMIHGRDWVDIFSYHPSLSLQPLRVYRDESFILAMYPVLEQFVHELLEARLKLEAEFGPFDQIRKERSTPEILVDPAMVAVLGAEWNDFAVGA